MAMTLDGSNGVTFNDSSLQGAAASPFGLKNRIINGDMRIDQRNAGAATTPSATGVVYNLDRWGYSNIQASKFTIQQTPSATETGYAVRVGAGFTNYLSTTVASAYTPLTGDLFAISQFIEGLNITDLAWGTSSAKTVTLSFWVNSSLTGTFGGAIANQALNRSYPFTYTISAANTWEQKSITISGDTTGTWRTDSDIGIRLYLSLGAGASYTGTAGAWAAAGYTNATGATNVIATASATWRVTGVQLEIGTSATPFERRPYGQELINCQRYYEKSYDYSVVPGTATGIGAVFTSGSNGGVTTSYLYSSYEYKVTKRGTPTNTYYDQSGNSAKCNREYFGVSSTANSNLAESYFGTTNALLYSASGSNSGGFAFQYVSSAEL